MTDPNNLEPRLVKMERDIASANENPEQARGQAAAARALATGADRDVSDVRQQLRAHTGTLNALRQTQLDNHREFIDFRDETRSTLAKLLVGQQQITHLLGRLGDSDK